MVKKDIKMEKKVDGDEGLQEGELQ